MNISNPHDKLFREIWSDKAVAVDFLRNYLPEGLLRYIFNAVDTTKSKLKEIVEKSVSPKRGEYIMTLAERLRKEGYQEGVQVGIQKEIHETIDMGLSLRFPQAHQELMPRVMQIQDLEKLKKIKEAIKTAKDISELRAVIEQ